MAKIQIDEQLFFDLVKAHLLDDTTEETAARIRMGLQTKVDALIRRRLYTESKTAPTPEAREKARQAYLDEIGMNDDFRW